MALLRELIRGLITLGVHATTKRNFIFYTSFYTTSL